ncbi:MAG TPA: hypothetical protein V6C57_02825, partial [Coleofasciculaceae cyanobacterium]
MIKFKKLETRKYQYGDFTIYWDWDSIADHPQGGSGYWAIAIGHTHIDSTVRLKDARDFLS